LPSDTDRAQNKRQQCRQEAAGGTVEQTHTREKPMCAGHNHGGAAERGRDNDECVALSLRSTTSS
jgi:hypothetical protein